MSLARSLWGAVTDLMDNIGAFQEDDIPEVKNTIPNPTNSLCPADLQHTSKKDDLPDKYHTGIAVWIEAQRSDAIQNSQSKDANAEEVTISGEVGLESNDDTDLKDKINEHQQNSSNALIAQDPPKFNTYLINRDLAGLNQTLRQDNVQYLRWQDGASMTIKNMKEEAQVQKHEARAAKKAATRAKATMQQQLDDYKRQIVEQERENVRLSDEHAQAIKAQEGHLQEVKEELEAQKKTADRAAAAAERQITELQTKHTEEISTAERMAKREAIREKNDMYHAKVAADREVKRLKEENESLESKREKADSRALGAEGRAKGLQDQLGTTKKRVDYWETMYNQTEEKARNEILSACAADIAQSLGDEKQTTSTSSEEEEMSVLVEKLRKENCEFQERDNCMTPDLKMWDEAWEKAAKDQKIWEQRLQEYYEADKQKALSIERAKGGAKIGQDVREQDIRRQCEKEKQKAVAEERENGRVQREAQKCSLTAQFTVKLNSHTNRELQKLRRRVGIGHGKQLKVKKCQVKWEFRQAVSRAVEVERSLLQRQLRTQFQTELSNYKTQLECEHANSRTQSEAQNGADPVSQTSLHEEIKKRDGYIEKHKENLKRALDEKRESENTLKGIKEENERLSRQAIAYEGQKSIARQTKSGLQINLMARESAQALKLFTEIDLLGLDEKHRKLLHELVVANKVVRDMRITIEDGDSVDYEEFHHRLEQVVESSDIFDALDPRERPALHAQLSGTYSVIGGLTNILTGERGETTQQEILERIYEDSDKGKGKQGANIGPGTASGPPFSSNGGENAAPLPQPNGINPFISDQNGNLQTSFSNTSAPKSTSTPSSYPSTTISNPKAPGFQDGPEHKASATAPALQCKDDTNLGTSDSFDPDSFDLDSIDWTDPASLEFNPDLTLPASDP